MRLLRWLVAIASLPTIAAVAIARPLALVFAIGAVVVVYAVIEVCDRWPYWMLRRACRRPPR